MRTGKLQGYLLISVWLLWIILNSAFLYYILDTYRDYWVMPKFANSDTSVLVPVTINLSIGIIGLLFSYLAIRHQRNQRRAFFISTGLLMLVVGLQMIMFL